MNAIFFDVDDTIYDLAEPFKQACRKVFPEYDLKFNELFVASRKYSDEVFEDAQNDIITIQDMHVYRIVNALKDFDIHITREQALEFQLCYSAEQKRITASPAMQELFKRCSQNGTHLGVITNGLSDHQWAKIHTLGLEQWIPREQILVSGDYGVAKPHTELFRQAEKKISGSVGEIWYIGDSFGNDIIGAKQAGWKCIWFNRRNYPEPRAGYLPDYTVYSEDELIRLVDTIFNDQG